MTSRVMGLGVLVATAVHAQAVAPAPPPAPSIPVPVPRYVPAGAGAPVVGQPGDQAAPVARSPNTRVLPPTPEPGLWAADELGAVKRPTAPQPDVDELLLARPSPGAPALPICRQRVLRASKASGSEETRHNLPRTSRECLTARLLLHCFHREQYEFEASLRQTPRTEEVMRAIERREKEAITTALWQARLCEAFQSLPSIEGLHAVIVAWLERQFPRPVSR
ncbi:hypothetical protein CYFUS_009801 [Cystobacter fuscus]|uniref:Uncharacterized protein n=2 Tax=Cystobacter fuscus TaxID=43 RepID=A0A250JKA9_9BACT|nr:hypothetical protein CYFUS_009801 [Cystobacter fuscus]